MCAVVPTPRAFWGWPGHDFRGPPIEAGELAAGVEQAVLAAGPGGVRFRVDFEGQRVAFLAVGRAGLVARPVRPHDRDLLGIRVNAVLPRTIPQKPRGL